MNEIPSSAVTAARAVVSSSSGDGAGVMAVSPMANPAHGVDLTAVLGHVEALGLDDVPLDLLFRARGLVEMAPRGDAPLHAGDDGTGDWSGATHDAARLAGLSAPGLDLVFDGHGEGVHLAADHPAFSAAADVMIPAALVDPMVDLGTLASEADAFAPSIHDAPVHVDVAADDAARFGLEALDVRAPELSWLAAINGGGLHVGEAWAWSDLKGGYVFDHYV
ncbi:MAG TPA: hypothetical protein VJR58_32005 [Vineibacter sp.]|nr:hypothetical protein [Vineibacter sp.]